MYALSQRPIAVAAFSEKNGPAAWKSLPAWAAVGTADLAAGSDVTRSMAQRAGAQITEIDGSHVIMISQPDAVAPTKRSHSVMVNTAATSVSGTLNSLAIGTHDQQEDGEVERIERPTRQAAHKRSIGPSWAPSTMGPAQA